MNSPPVIGGVWIHLTVSSLSVALDFEDQNLIYQKTNLPQRPETAGLKEYDVKLFGKNSGLKKRRPMRLEMLEGRHLLAGAPIISEFLAINQSTVADEDGEFTDWIEVFNTGGDTVNLNGFWLTDDPNDLTGWRFPDSSLDAGSYQVVFASGKDRAESGSELHTDFKLDGDGEYLALIAPDGQTVVHEFSPAYPPQVADVSYGASPDLAVSTLIEAGATASYHAPSTNLLQETWSQVEFNDATWATGPTGIGFDTGVAEMAPMVEAILNLDPVGYWRFEETEGGLAANDGTAGESLDGTYKSSPTRTESGPGLADTLFQFDDSNSATKFDGRREAITFTSSPLSDLTEFSMMGMIHPEFLSTNRIGLFGQNDAIEFGFISPGTLQIWTPGGGSLNVDYEFPLNEWHHVAVTGDGESLAIYLDGQLAGQGGSPTNNYGSSSSEFRIAGDGVFDTSDNYFDGSIDEVAIFDRALTAAQVNSLVADPGQEPGDGAGQFGDLIATDVETEMLGLHSSMYVRIPFEVSDPTVFNQLILELNYDDGFVAYLNGTEIARRNAPGEEGVRLGHDAVATRTRADDLAVAGELLDISNSLDALTFGTNMLAIHALNAAVDNPDLLVRPILRASTVTVNPELNGYLTTPTPGKNNNPVSVSLGPLVHDVDHSPAQPNSADAITVTAEVVRTLADISQVELVYRVMFKEERVIPMSDDGLAADSAAGDGIYTAVIPGDLANPGEMVRWYVRATDSTDATGRLPTFEIQSGQNQSSEYFGTMIADSQLSSEIPILNWFVENERNAGERRGTRASIFFNGEFYDNLFVRQRGGSTAGNRKRNFKFDFKGNQFRFDPQYGRVEEFNLNSTATDKAYVRQALAFDAYSAAGAPGSISFPMHVRRNDEFYGVFVFIEEPDEYLLEREGFDPNGALYKVYNEFTSASSVRKKTREHEGNTDLADFISNVRTLNGEELHNYLIDNVNLPATLNYLVGTVLVHQNDNPHKNHFLYRDTEGTGEWMFLPWDNDLSWGSNWVGNSYHDQIYADMDVITEGPVPGHNPAYVAPSHPFVNTESYREWNNHWNRLMDAVLTDPVIRTMYLRRLRTTMDELMGEPGTTNSYFDQQWDGYVQAMSQDAALDKAKWFSPWPFGTDQSFPEAVDIVKNEYLEVRRQHFYVNHSVDVETSEPIVILPEFAPATYFIPGDDSLGTDWVANEFDDSQWRQGETGFGFSGDDDFDGLIRTEIDLREASEDGTAVFLRVPFNIDDPATVDALTLRMKFDDGFIAYINGTEVHRQNLRKDGPQSYNSKARSHRDSEAVVFVNYNISEHLNALKPGENLLAIHALNSSKSSSDMLMLPELVDGIISTVEVAGIPHAQVGNPAISFDPNLYDANPVSGNQDEEFVKIDNPLDDAVDISGWRLEGGIEHEFPLGTIIPANSSLYVSPESRAFRARAAGPTGGEGRLVQGGYAGHLSSLGDIVHLTAADGTRMDTLNIAAEPSPAQEFLRISELNYNPNSLDDATEFIELLNLGEQPLDLSGVTISQGPSEPLVVNAGTTIQPGDRLVVVADTAAFLAAYPEVNANQVIGEYVGNLDNGGERIKLDDANGSTIMDFRYGDRDPWPEPADGVGATLVLSDPESTPNDEFDKYYRWSGSSEIGGSPAATSRVLSGIVINEVLSNTDDPAVQTDAIELYNPTASSVDISGWYLSDSADNLLKFQIPVGTNLLAGGFITYDENDFSFALNGNDGEAVWLVSSTTPGSVFGFVDDVHFGAAKPGESFGRSPDATGRLEPMTNLSLGSTNPAPRVGPVVISEVHYNPGRPSNEATAIDPNITSGDLEFVEIYNPTGTPLDLSQWRIRGGIDFNFDSLTTIGAGEVVVLIPFNPEGAGNVARLAAFRAHHGIDESITLLGGYGGQLSNSFDRVQLQRPDNAAADPADIARLYEDEVLYDDRTPWPAADGNGHSLQRDNVEENGNSATAWLAAAPTPGQFESGPLRGDFDGNGIVNQADINLLFEAMRVTEIPDLVYDLTNDGLVNELDRDEMVKNVLHTDYGDTDLNQVFNSGDLVIVFAAGKYEDQLPLNAGWGEGDWNGDGDFDSSDLVLAFQDGGYSNQATSQGNLTRNLRARLGAAFAPIAERRESSSLHRSTPHDFATFAEGTPLAADLADKSLTALFDEQPKENHKDSNVVTDDLLDELIQK
ncbi:MAG: lamin tail domain-containing protein [Pirellulaceae bacterium]|nr:lamin tail domain-containing protein [Pirellulaceae bacterium]